MARNDVVSEAVDLPTEHTTRTDLCAEHVAITSELGRVHAVAERLATTPPVELRTELAAVHALIADRVIAHVRAEHERRAHLAFRDHRACTPTDAEVELQDLAERLERAWPRAILRDADEEAVRALRSLLFDIHTVARLHLRASCC